MIIIEKKLVTHYQKGKMIQPKIYTANQNKATGDSLRFEAGGHMGLTPGQSIEKAHRAFPLRGIWGHAPPGNFEILKLQRCVCFPAF